MDDLPVLPARDADQRVIDEYNDQFRRFIARQNHERDVREQARDRVMLDAIARPLMVTVDSLSDMIPTAFSGNDSGVDVDEFFKRYVSWTVLHAAKFANPIEAIEAFKHVLCGTALSWWTDLVDEHATPVTMNRLQDTFFAKFRYIKPRSQLKGEIDALRYQAGQSNLAMVNQFVVLANKLEWPLNIQIDRFLKLLPVQMRSFILSQDINDFEHLMRRMRVYQDKVEIESVTHSFSNVTFATESCGVCHNADAPSKQGTSLRSALKATSNTGIVLDNNSARSSCHSNDTESTEEGYLVPDRGPPKRANRNRWKSSDNNTRGRSRQNKNYDNKHDWNRNDGSRYNKGYNQRVRSGERKTGYRNYSQPTHYASQYRSQFRGRGNSYNSRGRYSFYKPNRYVPRYRSQSPFRGDYRPSRNRFYNRQDTSYRQDRAYSPYRDSSQASYYAVSTGPSSQQTNSYQSNQTVPYVNDMSNMQSFKTLSGVEFVAKQPNQDFQ